MRLKKTTLAPVANKPSTVPSASPSHRPRARSPVEPEDFSKRAKRNANAYTGFVVMSAVSTALTLVGVGLTVHSAIRYGRSAGKEMLLKAAGNNIDALFDRGGALTDDAKSYSNGVPGLYGMLQSIERRAESENDDISTSIREMKAEAHGNRKSDEKRLRDTAIVAGCGVLGMLIFISAAKITRHRGILLYDQPSRRRLRAELAPRLSPQEFGAALTLRF